jgi:hypothetical protein
MIPIRKNVGPVLVITCVSLLLVSVALGIGFNLFISSVTARPVLKITYYSPPISGIGGGCAPLWDREGTPHCAGFFNLDVPLGSDYTGPAPLYEIREGATPLSGTGNYIYVSPNDIDLEKSYYPLQLRLSVEEKKLTMGESSSLSISAYVLDTFPGKQPVKNDYFVIPITNTEIISISFSIDSVSFDFSPADLNSPNLMFGINHPVNYVWIISPKSTALGKQELLLRLVCKGRFVRTLGVRLEVHSVGLISPLLTTTIGAIGTFILGIFGLMKLIPEIWVSYKRAFGREGSPRKREKRTPFE